jgi:hypothetical protein
MSLFPVHSQSTADCTKEKARSEREHWQTHGCRNTPVSACCKKAEAYGTRVVCVCVCVRAETADFTRSNNHQMSLLLPTLLIYVVLQSLVIPTRPSPNLSSHTTWLLLYRRLHHPHSFLRTFLIRLPTDYCFAYLHPPCCCGPSIRPAPFCSSTIARQSTCQDVSCRQYRACPHLIIFLWVLPCCSQDSL